MYLLGPRQVLTPATQPRYCFLVRLAHFRRNELIEKMGPFRCAARLIEAENSKKDRGTGEPPIGYQIILYCLRNRCKQQRHCTRLHTLELIGIEVSSNPPGVQRQSPQRIRNQPLVIVPRSSPLNTREPLRCPRTHSCKYLLHLSPPVTTSDRRDRKIRLNEFREFHNVFRGFFGISDTRAETPAPTKSLRFLWQVRRR